jgi:hypothetical protein
MGLSVGCCEGRASERGTYVGILLCHRTFLFHITKCEDIADDAGYRYHYYLLQILLLSLARPNVNKHVHRQAIRRLHAYWSTSCTQSSLTTYNAYLYKYLILWSIILHTNQSFYFIHVLYTSSLLYITIYTRNKMWVSLINFVHLIKIKTIVNQKNKLVPVSVRTLLISHEGVE